MSVPGAPGSFAPFLVPVPFPVGWLPPDGPGLLALPGERERAEDVLLRVRVVEDVDREGANRLLVATEGEDLVDPAVAVPVRDNGVRARLLRRRRGTRDGEGRQDEPEDEHRKKEASVVGVWHEAAEGGSGLSLPALRGSTIREG